MNPAGIALTRSRRSQGEGRMDVAIYLFEGIRSEGSPADETAAERLAQEIGSRIALRWSGLVEPRPDPFEAHGLRPLSLERLPISRPCRRWEDGPYYPGKQDPHKYSSQFGVATADHSSQGQEINHGKHGNSRKREFGSTFLLPSLSVFSVVKPL
jgi:hypothetical protein